MKLKIKGISYHRNGVCGEGFHVVLFDWKDQGTLRHMVATVFAQSGQCAVLDSSLTAAGVCDFPNRWRGDHFEHTLRSAIEAEYAKSAATGWARQAA